MKIKSRGLRTAVHIRNEQGILIISWQNYGSMEIATLVLLRREHSHSRRKAGPWMPGLWFIFTIDARAHYVFWEAAKRIQSSL
jgi:hypothetical protein